MLQAAAPLPVERAQDDEERRILRSNVTWATYVALREADDSSGVRMTFLEGRLEIMNPGRRHEMDKKQIARLLELFCIEREIVLYAYGSMTFRSEASARGLEPDECYCRDEDRAVPDIALEVAISAPGIDKLEIYRELGVREVWLFKKGGFQVFELKAEGYEAVGASRVLPELDLTQIAYFAAAEDQPAALLAFRRELRTTAT